MPLKILSFLITTALFSLSMEWAAAKEPPGTVRCQGKLADASQLIVKFKDGPALRTNQAAVNQVLAATGMEMSKRQYKNLPKLRVLKLSANASAKPAGKLPSKAAFPNAKALEQSIKQLQQSGLFEYVEPDWKVFALQTPTDAALNDGRLWGLRNTGQSGGAAGVDVDTDNAWNQTLGDPSVVIGVIDSGVRYTHQDLADNMWVNPGEIPGNNIDDDNNGFIDDIHGINAINNSGDPMDDNDHGTHVAGTISATANNGSPHVGVAPGCRIMALKFLGAGGSGNTSDAIACVDYATTMGAQLTNNSWGGGGFSQGLSDAIQRANTAGSLFIAAAGNSSQNTDTSSSFPSNYDLENVISVAAIDRNGNLANFSNFGAQTVDIAAPGVSIFSALSSSDSAYGSLSGTSMASPHVAGVAALIISRYGPMSIAEWRNRLLITAVPLDSLSGRIVTGGRVDAQEALDISDDGILELRASSDGRVDTESIEPFFINVTDLSPVLDATVSADLGDGTLVSFLDNGVTPDTEAGDGIYSANLTTSLSSPFSFTINASAPGKQAQSQDFEFQVVSPPVNDDFSDRILLSPGSTQASGSNNFASIESGEPVNPAPSGPNSVWWEWVAPSSTNVTISTSGSNFDTTLAIYQGTSLTGLSVIGSNDDANNSLQSAVSFNAIAGTSYLIRVAGYQGNTGNINLNYPPPAGANDGSPFFTSLPPSNVSQIVGSTLSLSVSAGGQAPISFQWLFNGAPIAEATEPTLTIPNTSALNSGTYTVTISNPIGSQTSSPSNVRIEPVGVISGNDNFANAIELTSFGGSTTSENTRATGENSEPNHASVSAPLNSLWWTWTSPLTGSFRVDTFGSSFDTTLAIYQGDSLSNLSLLGSNDDTAGTRSQVTVSVVEGQTLRIAVDGFSSATGNITLNYQASLQDAPGPLGNDSFALRTDLGSSPNLSLSGSNNRSATGEVNEPNHAANSSPIQSIWWSWTAPASGSISIDTLGSNFDTTLAAYTGSSLASLTTLASNDDDSGLLSAIRFPVTQGTSYQIAVDGFGGNNGDIVLNLDFTPDVPLTPRQLLEIELIAAGLTGDDLDPMSRPFADGLSNLMRYAFNLNLDRSDRRYLDPANLAASSGLPAFELIEGPSGPTHLRVSFLRNPANGLTYAPMFSQDLVDPILMNAPESVLDLPGAWERVSIQQPIPDPNQPIFGHFSVTLP